MKVALNQRGQLQVGAEANQYPCPPYTCCDCGQAVVLRRRREKWYFSHVQGRRPHMPESEAHQAGKAALTQWLADSGLAPENERVILTGAQRIDVCVPSLILAGEYQCSPLALTALRQRHQGYQMANWRDWWILGENYVPQQRWQAQTAQFCQYSPALGFYLYLFRAPYRQLELWHHLTRAPHKSQWIAGGCDRFALTEDWAHFQRWHNAPHPSRPYSPLTVAAWREHLVWQGRRRDPRYQQLLQLLYTHGRQVNDVPAWCFPLTPLPPVFSGSFFIWAVQHWLGITPVVPRLNAPLLSIAAQKKWIDFPIHWLHQQQGL
ncbi:competence protein CoiA family protein [Schleiferilactobacillus harbinensis]|uniref:competence protein CoiA family protein n=1 Tax=Schleiferilactobacillus harbinensis TaxID=304207 RepID=UPI00242D7BDE|nr:competence protein CoiA family protein [Schleiferilactobacillus harbinensis]MCI1687637.1 hypothetical protein [Schleiferilactobacillus harbinensis]MCI1782521.1 hypothetical protein [Schleiferilactobacillus harbinensis]MCI1850609.1 hypothetical protein [Schleiferilactobacillus harbinensis]